MVEETHIRHSLVLVLSGCFFQSNVENFFARVIHRKKLFYRLVPPIDLVAGDLRLFVAEHLLLDIVLEFFALLQQHLLLFLERGELGLLKLETAVDFVGFVHEHEDHFLQTGDGLII